MQVLIRRRIIRGARVKFALWVKFDVNDEERALINQYSVARGFITIERRRQDLYRAAIIGFVAAALFGSYLNILPSRTATIVASGFIIAFVLVTWLAYEQLRFAIRISDMLNGREFKHKSLTLMARRERQTIGYALVFLQFLEKLKEWEGTEVITLGEEHEPVLRLVTDTYAAA